MNWTSEEQLAAAVVAWLQDLKWTVYQEVQVARGDPIADIVAVQGRLVWVVECKTTLSIALMAQAAKWRIYAHYVSVAVPIPVRRPGGRRIRPNRGRAFAENILRDHGIGLIDITHGEPFETIPPQLNRKPWVKQLRESLNERHLSYAPAGNAEGRRWTPFQETCDQIRREVRNTPGITLKELMGRITHHYSSSATARSCIAKWVQAGVIRGVRCERDGRIIRLYPQE